VTYPSTRTEQLAQVAQQLGMQFMEDDEWGLKALLRDFKLYKSGHSQKVRGLMQSTSSMLEEKVSIFDFRYIIQAGNTPVTNWQTVFFIQSKQLGLPQMLLKPEHFFHKIGAWLGMQDIDFEEFPDFSDSFLLQGDDETMIRKTMKENVIRFFLVNKKWCLESIGYFLIIYREKHLVEPLELKALFHNGMKLYNEFRKNQGDM
jgi:hypothetical protein